MRNETQTGCLVKNLIAHSNKAGVGIQNFYILTSYHSICYGLNCDTSKFMYRSSKSPVPWNVSGFGERALKELINLKWGHGNGPYFNLRDVLIRTENAGTRGQATATRAQVEGCEKRQCECNRLQSKDRERPWGKSILPTS